MLDSTLKIVQSLVEFLACHSNVTNAQLETASEAFRKAIAETQIYLGALERGEKRDYDKEATLVRLWSDASRTTRNITGPISAACQGLSTYWASPSSPPDKETKQISGYVGDLERLSRRHQLKEMP